MTVVVTRIRPGKDKQRYLEHLLHIDSNRLVVDAPLTPSIREDFTLGLSRNGLIPQGALVHSLKKYYFFNQYFSILEFRDPDGILLGYYSDIAAPLQTQGNEYAIVDWFLDLWIWPDGQFCLLDEDEFAVAVQDHLLTSSEADAARRTFAHLQIEAAAGRFPSEHLI